jgi:hypothetical protein
MNKTDFDQYFLEYSLLSTSAEINAFWERMDIIMLNMNEEEKRNFFMQLEQSIENSLQKAESISATLLAQTAKAA